MTEQIRLYRLKGPTYTRFEGGRRTRYPRGSEVRLTDSEAKRFTKAEIELLETGAPPAAQEAEGAQEPDAPGADRDRVHALLADARAMTPAAFRQEVVASGVLDTVPRSRGEIVAALEALVKD